LVGQAERTDLVVFAPIACELTALGEKDEVGCTVPLLDDVESFVDFASQRFRMKIATQEDRFDGLPSSASTLYVGCWTLLRVKRRKIDSV
jgi:hypothetical protein